MCCFIRNPNHRENLENCATGCDRRIHRYALHIALLALVWSFAASAVSWQYWVVFASVLEREDPNLVLKVWIGVILMSAWIVGAGMFLHYMFKLYSRAMNLPQHSPLVATQAAEQHMGTSDMVDISMARAAASGDSELAENSS